MVVTHYLDMTGPFWHGFRPSRQTPGNLECNQEYNQDVSKLEGRHCERRRFELNATILVGLMNFQRMTSFLPIQHG
jgi:hypothetical protein